MLREHLWKTSVKVGEGADRAGVAACFIQKTDRSSAEGTVDAVILDDGMQVFTFKIFKLKEYAGSFFQVFLTARCMFCTLVSAILWAFMNSYISLL